MVENMHVRTDLALEEKERFEEDNVEIHGVVLEEDYDQECEMRVTKVEIQTENGARMMGKPVGIYFTLEAPNLAVLDEPYQKKISKHLTGYIERLLKKNVEREKQLSILVVGLGNRMVTPDALGPLVVEHLSVTRHLVKEYGRFVLGTDVTILSAIAPGVMGQTGMQSMEVVRGVVAQTRPDLVIAVDALAARNTRRLNRTIQISDTGIHPGSGVGNHQTGLTKETLGVPVIGIGVPTVIDAATIVNDTMESFINEMELPYSNRAEKNELLEKLISPHLNGMFMTPKEEDEFILQMSMTIAESLNHLVSGI